MNRLSRLALVLMLAALASLTFASGIKWNTDIKKALKIAKKLKKPVMIDFFADY